MPALLEGVCVAEQACAPHASSHQGKALVLRHLRHTLLPTECANRAYKTKHANPKVVCKQAIYPTLLASCVGRVCVRAGACAGTRECDLSAPAPDLSAGPVLCTELPKTQPLQSLYSARECACHYTCMRARLCAWCGRRGALFRSYFYMPLWVYRCRCIMAFP